MRAVEIKYMFFLLVVFGFFLSDSPRSAIAQGRGQPLGRPVGVAVDADGRIFVVDEGQDTVLRIDATTGDREAIASREPDSGEPLSRPVGIAVNDHGELLLVDRQLDAIIAVDANTGSRRVVSGCPEVPDPCPVAIIGSGLGFVNPVAIAVINNDTLVVVDIGDGRDGLFQVNMNTGNRDFVSGASMGSGPTLGEPVGVAVGPLGNVYVIDETLDAVLDVNLVTGDRTVVSGCSEESDPCPQPLVGRGPAFLGPSSITSASRGTLYVTDIDLGAIIRVDTLTGNRTIVSDATTGVGTPFFAPVGMAVENATSLLVVDSSRRSLLRVNLLRGDREVVSKRTDLILSPATGTYVSGQDFDFAIILDGVGTISTLSVNLNGLDITDQIQSCSRELSLGADGMILQCRDVMNAFNLQAGRHNVRVRASITSEALGALSIVRIVTWNLLQTQ